MSRKTKFKHPRLLSVERQNTPVFPEDGDEIYCSGVFYFNVSALLEWLKENPQIICDMEVKLWALFLKKKIVMWKLQEMF